MSATTTTAASGLPGRVARYDERTRQWRALAPMHTIPTDVLGWSVRGDVAYVGVKDNATPARLVVERYCAGENAWRVVGSPVRSGRGRPRRRGAIRDRHALGRRVGDLRRRQVGSALWLRADLGPEGQPRLARA